MAPCPTCPATWPILVLALGHILAPCLMSQTRKECHATSKRRETNIKPILAVETAFQLVSKISPNIIEARLVRCTQCLATCPLNRCPASGEPVLPLAPVRNTVSNMGPISPSPPVEFSNYVGPRLPSLLVIAGSRGF